MCQQPSGEGGAVQSRGRLQGEGPGFLWRPGVGGGEGRAGETPLVLGFLNFLIHSLSHTSVFLLFSAQEEWGETQRSSLQH